MVPIYFEHDCLKILNFEQGLGKIAKFKYTLTRLSVPVLVVLRAYKSFHGPFSFLTLFREISYYPTGVATTPEARKKNCKELRRPLWDKYIN